jgi:hypothetical protein
MGGTNWTHAVRALGGAACLLSGGCTFGAVTDASTGAGIPGASLVFQQLDTSSPVVTDPSSASFPAASQSPSVQTWTAAELASTEPPSSSTYTGLYWLNPYVAERPGDSTATFVPEGWTRVTVSVRDYDTAYVYRNHQYRQGRIDILTPYSGPGQGGQPPYAVPETVTSMDTSFTESAEEDFVLWRNAIEIPGLCFGGFCIIPPRVISVDHPRLPDLIVDVRSLLPTGAGAAVPSPQEVGIGLGPVTAAGAPAGDGFCCNTQTPAGSLPPSTQECLAFPLSVANVGNGRFEVQVTSSAPNTVTQVTYAASGGHTFNPVTGGSVVNDLPGGFHLVDLVEIRLRGPITSSCDTESAASACPVVSSASKAICLDEDGVFDRQIFEQYSGGVVHPALNGAPFDCQRHQMGDIGPDIDMGLEPGYADLYPIGNPYNYLDITNVSPGDYWLEAEINPTGALIESDRSNNISRAQVTITSPPPGGGGTHQCTFGTLPAAL